MLKNLTLSWHALIGVLALHVAVLFNAAVAIRRFSALHSSHDSAAGLIALELLLVLALTAAIFYLLSLAGKAIFKTVVCGILVLSAACAYYMLFFNVVIGYGIIQATLSTDVDLSKEVIGIAIIAFVLVFGVLPAVVVSRIRLPEAGRLARLAMFALCMVAGSAAYVAYPHLLRDGGAPKAKAASPLGVVAHSYVPSNWMTGLGLSALNSYEGAARRQSLVNPADKFKYHATADLQGTYLVIVIGESARYDRMGILGHSRPNTPEMLQTKNLTALHATSCNTSTKLSLECMFVRGEAVDDGGMGGRQQISEKTVFSVLKKLGFTSELFSMQGEVWFYNSVESDFYKHRELIYAEDRNIGKPIDDLALIPELQESIDRHPQGKHVVILHSKGSHHFYTARYPRSYAWYTPECANSEMPCGAQELLNSYDNSIAYTDHFLGQVIDGLKDKKALLIYTSDHGESIGENAHLHGTPKQMAPPEQRMVPLVIWASQPFLQNPRNAARFAQLNARKDLAVAHEDLFDSILGCLGIESADGGIDSRRNLCREQ